MNGVSVRARVRLHKRRLHRREVCVVLQCILKYSEMCVVLRLHQRRLHRREVCSVVSECDNVIVCGVRCCGVV